MSTVASAGFGLRPRLRLPLAFLLGFTGVDLLLLARRPHFRLVLKPLLTGLQPRQAVLSFGEARGQLDAPAIAEELVLLGVHRLGLGQYGRHLPLNGLGRPVGVQSRVRLDLGAIQRDHAETHQARRMA